MSPLSSEERRELLAIARRAIFETIVNNKDWSPPRGKGALAELRGAFVTLHRRRRLRGCVGQTEGAEPLAQFVAQCAVAAATQDPRFRAVKLEEIPELEIEISALTPLVSIRPEEIEIGRHGLLIQHGRKHGLLLPQVAVEHKLTAPRFLEETCEKAGLPRDAWKEPATNIFGFTAEIFSEAEFHKIAR